MENENNSAQVSLDKSQRVGNGKLISYSVGLAGQNMTYGYISGWLFYYMTTILKIDSIKVGLITSISRIWDSVNDPLIGAIVDRHRFKNGEKLRPYIVLTAPIIGILSALMFMPFNSNGKIAVTLICIEYLLWDLFYSFQDTALWGMIAVSSPVSEERKRVSQWVSIGAGAGGVIAGGFQMVRSILGSTFNMSDVFIFALFGVLFGLGGELLSMFAYKMPEAIEAPKSEESIFEAIFVLRHNRTLLLISLARFFSYTTSALLPWAYYFESKESFDFGFASFDGPTTQVVYSIITGSISVVTMLFSTKFAEKIGGMKRILVTAQAANIIFRVICYFVGFESVAQVYIVMAIMAVVSIPTNMMDIAHRSLTSDSIDEVEYKTGKRTEGISFSMQNFISKLSSAVTLFLSGVILDRVKYNNALPNYQQGALYNKWVWPIFMLGPVIGQALYLITILFVRDNKEEKQRIEAELYERRKAVAEMKEEVEE